MAVTLVVDPPASLAVRALSVDEYPDPREPRYRRVETLGRDATVALRSGLEARVTLSVATLLG